MSSTLIHPTPRSGLRAGVRALRYRNFRLFFSGQVISLIGTWMQRIAMSWLVYRLTGSAMMLGLVGFAGPIPTFLLTPFAGVLADRGNRRRMLVATQSLAMLQALILATLVLTDTVAIWHVVLLSIVLGIINAFDIPIRQSMMVELVDHKEDLSNAIALNSTAVNSARLLGPTVAGLLIAMVGEGMCFLLNGLSYIPVVGALWAMRLERRPPSSGKANGWADLKEGIAYGFRFAPIRDLLLLLSLISLMGMPYTVLMPIFAKDILGGGPHSLGFLMGASGVGALIAAIYLAFRRSVRGLGRVIPWAAGLFGAGLIAFSQSRWMTLSLALMVVSGFGMIVVMAATNTIIQTIVDDDKRGRVMSFYAMAFMGMTPFGSLLAGSLASRWGAPSALLVGGLACIAGAALFARRISVIRKMLPPLQVKMGIFA